MKTIVLSTLLGMSASLLAAPEVTYVGLGRYVCKGNAQECEPIRQRNESLELQRQQARELEQQRIELQRQTELMRNQQQSQKGGNPYRY